MKINDILKEENAGKVYIIKNTGWEGEKVTINEFPAAEITLDGRTDNIEDVAHLAYILEMEFEEEKPYKETSGREALKLMLDGGVAYAEPELETKYYITNGILKYRRPYKISDSMLTLSDILNSDWYIKN